MKNTTLQLNSVAEFNRYNVSYNGMGVMGSIPVGTTANVDLKINDDHFLTGGQLNVKNGSWGDSCSMQVVDSDGSLKGQYVLNPDGSWAPYTYDQIPGYPLLAQFYTNCQIMDQVQRQQNFSAPYPAKIRAGMTLRLIYTSTAMAGPNPQAACNLDLHRIMVMA